MQVSPRLMVTTGASDDLRKVHEISRSMVTQYGMGTELQSKQLPADDYSMSDHTRRSIDEEQQYLTDLAHRRALKLVSENRTLLEAFAFTLLDKEVIEREDIERIVAAYRQNGGGCAFWFLDGSLIDDGVPLELLRRGLIAAPPPGSSDPFPLAEEGRELAGRLSQGS